MKKNFTLFKVLLVACGLLGGVNLWATDITNVRVNFDGTFAPGTPGSYVAGSGEVIGSASVYTWNPGAGISDGHLLMSNGNITFAMAGNAITAENVVHISFEIAFGGLSSTNANQYIKIFDKDGGTIVEEQYKNWNEPVVSTMGLAQSDIGLTGSWGNTAWSNRVKYEFTLDYPNNKIDLHLTKIGGSTSVDKSIAMAEGKPLVASLYFQSDNQKAYERGFLLDNVLITTESDDDVAENPAVTLTAISGSSRTYSISFNEGETLHYKAPGDADYSTTTTSPKVVTTSTSGTLYTYTTMGTATSETVETTVNAVPLTLNAPTFLKSGYSNENYQITISSNQTGIGLNPTASIYYRVGETGDFALYSAPVLVKEGKAIYAYTQSDGYTNSSTSMLQTTPRPKFSTVWSIDFAGQATEDKGGVTIGEEAFTADGVSFGNITATGLTSNDNFGIKVGTTWLLRHNNRGLYSQNGGGTPIGVANVIAGQYIKVNYTSQPFDGAVGAELLDELSTNTELILRATADGNVRLNFARYVCIQSIEVMNASASATIGSTGWTTFASPYALDLSNMTASEGNVKAYYASAVGEYEVTMTSTESTGVAAGEGLMLKGTAGATITIPVVASGEAIDGNMLKGCTKETVLTANSNYYVMVNNGNDEAEFQSLEENGATIPAGKAYLNAIANGANLRIVFAGEATGIANIEAAKAENGAMFNMAGQRVNGSYKGIVIKNGKKVLVK